jgi:GH25 family lysozyme M1 (1,4-beta-N-acetylmuramidase)
MAQTATKKEKKLLIKWIIALVAVLAVMVCMALLLRPRRPAQETPPPETTRPTTSNDNFVYDDNGFLACTTRASIPGIDVSHHQGTIDWQQVRAAGVEFAIIRLGYRGYLDGQLHTDEQALRNLTEAKAAGLKIGAYIFSQAVEPAEAVEEARFAMDTLGDTKLDLPLVFDWEYVSDSARTANVTGDTLMDCVRSFCVAVEQAGFEPMVYFNQDLARTKLELDALEYPFWLAKYADDLAYPYAVRCWQYTDKGRIPGIDENVDIDLYFP